MAFDKRLIGLIIIVGFIAGLVGASYTHLMHSIQHFVYNYSSADHMSFGAAVARVSPVERLIPLIICGLIGGVGWFLIHRYGKGVVDIKTAVSGKMDMNPITTVLHATLQIITVAIGSPLGREVAPREASAGITTFLVKHFDIKQEDRQLLIACAAGAGFTIIGGNLYLRNFAPYLEYTRNECCTYMLWISNFCNSTSWCRGCNSIYNGST